MAYVRKKGNQLAIVRGERDPETGKVQQRTMFTLYSKAEAKAALGDHKHWFRQMVQEDSPNARVSWPSIDRAIREQMDHLPDLAPAKPERLDRHFREALVAFVRELLLADPQSLLSAAHLLEANRLELEYVQGLIDWRLGLTKQKPHEFNVDDHFFWRTAMNRKTVAHEGLGELAERYRKGDLAGTRALAQLLVECWSNFAEGHNFLGLVAEDEGDVQGALEHFRRAEAVGRTLFPKRIAKRDYWTDTDTRPFIRALNYQAVALNRLGEYRACLDLCDRLERDYGMDLDADALRIPALLNSESWQQAAAAARRVHQIHVHENLPLAFALYEMGDDEHTPVHLLRAALHSPRAVKVVCGLRATRPRTGMEADDHNTGVAMVEHLDGYLRKHRGAVRRFKRFLQAPDVAELVEEADATRHRWHLEHSSGDRTAFDRMHEMQTAEFARARARHLRASWLASARGR